LDPNEDPSFRSVKCADTQSPPPGNPVSKSKGGYIRDLTNDLYQKLGWKTSENHLDNLLRSTVIGLACHSGNQDCLNHAAELFQNWTQGQEAPSSLRSLVYNFGMSEIGREEHWNYMWNKYLVEESPAQKKTIMNGLAHVRKPYLILRYLEYAMDPEKVRSQDFFTILSYIAGNPVGRPLVWNFVREKWPALVERFTLNNRYLGNAVKKICSYFTTEQQLQEMRAFFAKYPDAGAGKRRRQQALEAVQNNIRWIDSHARGMKEWLEAEGPAPWYSPRLPIHTVPKHYDLHLHPNLTAESFKGHVTIQVILQKSTGRLLVHAAEGLNVTKTEVWSEEEKKEPKMVELQNVFLYEENEYLVLKTRERLPVGRYRLYFEFEGPLTLTLKGLYKSSYMDPHTQIKKFLATTQFAATYARRAFPCFDEPSFKTTFNVSVLHDATLFALSNTPVQNVSDVSGGLRLSRFEKTLPMVTYLLCLVVSDFSFKETLSDNGVKVRLYTAPHHAEKTEYALSIAADILTHYEKYFGIPFPLKKLDLVTIPDITYFGMENWGLITFKEEAILCDNTSSLATRYMVSTYVAHELAHMWFGDLVTMQWWDDLWLNEGFATYISRKGARHVEADIDQENDTGSRRLIEAMTIDRTIHTHPIVQRIERVNSEIYDDIEYSKGASVLRMLESFIGEDFREGISTYLTQHSFGGATTQDLWNSLTTASKQELDVGRVMDTWTRQMNYPYVTVDCHSSNESCSVQQHRFLEDPETAQLSAQPSPYNYVWHIPLTYRTYNSNEISHLLLNSLEKVHLPVSSAVLIKFNVDFSGYYSVNYDRSGWDKIINLLHDNHTVFSPADRVNLLYDSFSLASAGHVSYDIPLRLIGYLNHEKYHGAWRVAMSELNTLKNYFKADREVRELIKEYIRSLSKNLLKKYAWNDTGDYSERELRKVILQASCESRNQECLETAAYLFRQWTQGAQLLPDTKQVVYCYGLKVFNSEQLWPLMWGKYLEERDPREKLTLLDALTTVRNATLLERLIRYSRNESLVRKHDCYSVLKKIALNPKGFPLVTQLLFTQWDNLIRTYGRDETEEMAAKVFQGYTTEKDLQKVREFYQRHRSSTRHGTKAHAQALYSISRNIHWLRRHRQFVRDWLLTHVYMPWRNIRLPRHILPTHYDLLLRPNVTTRTFEGEERIHLNITTATDYLLLHESGLKILSTRLLRESKELNISEELSYKRNEYHVIILEKEIPPGTYLLNLEFSGKFSSTGSGMDRYEYKHRKTGDIRQLLATRFEATYARRVFPCFDEPSFKAKFKLSIEHPANQTALSNMPVEEQTNAPNGLVKTVFMESETMSTYLLFCAVSDFEYLQVDYKGKPIRAYAPPDRLEEAGHGLNMTLRLLNTLEEFFDVPYVLPKLDSVCIPGYAVPGMEHWGVISYNADRFLVNGSLTERRRIIYVDRVIAHEVVHQWFGNLVTMEWWDDLWLNEGMSTLIMYIPLKQYFPSINEVDVRKMSRMMCPDSRVDSHPIVKNVSTPNEIEASFNVISYQKGAAVMKMLQHIMKDDFRKGLSNYLKKYAYRNAETKDLWSELDNATDLDINVSALMDTWTRQMGFPFVELRRNGSSLTATQRWFSRNVNESREEQEALSQIYGFIWQIPLTFKNLATGNEYTLWLKNKTATFHISALEDEVVKFNPGFIGFYIVKYDDADWKRLKQKLIENHEVLSVSDRYNLLHDAFALAETDRLPYSVALDLTRYLVRERDPLPWNLFRDHVLHLEHSLDAQSPVRVLLKKYVANLTSDLYDEYVASVDNKSVFKKWDTKTGSCSFSYSDLDLESVLMDLACRSHNEHCLEALRQDMQLWLLGQNVTSDLHFVLSIPHFTNASLWTQLFEKMCDNETDRNTKFLLAEGLASFTTPTLVAKTIEAMVFDPRIDLELAKFMFLSLSNKPEAMRSLWNYATQHWKALMNRLGAQHDPTIGISHFCDKLKTTEYLGDFIRLTRKNPLTSDFVTHSCMEEIQNSIEWSIKYESQLIQWLQGNV
ncbi:endoplasmic reticulum aminopeptidase 2, partial [Nephila pilipes]